jgi:hypothetical protein
MRMSRARVRAASLLAALFLLAFSRAVKDGDLSPDECGDQNGARVKGATVRLIDGRGQEWASVAADDRGQFVFAGVAHGEYTLSCSHGGATGRAAGAVPGPELRVLTVGK